jgi:hypothetical protein
MANFDMNLLADRAEAFDGFLQLQVGADFYRFKSLQRLNINFNWLDEDRYDDSGNLVLVRDGQNHTFDMELVLTADEADTADPPTNVRTLSYWIYQKEILKQRVTGTYVGKFLTRASSPSWVNLRVTLDIQSIGIARENGGAITVPIDGRVIGFTNLKREAS